MEGTVSEQKKEYVALLLTMVLALWLFLESLYWVTMAHQVLEACLQCKPQQGATKLLKLLNKYLLMVTFENGENYLIWFKILNNGSIFDSIRNEKTLFAQHYFWYIFN